MARTLPAAILAALPSNSTGGAQPSVQIGSTDIVRRMTLAGTTGRSRARSSCILTSAGTLLLAAVDNTSLTSARTLSLMRITTVTSFSAWQGAGTSLDTNADPNAGCALIQTGSTIRVFYVDWTTKTTYYRQSTDDGQTWAARVQVATKPVISGTTYALCTGIAAFSTTDVTAAWYVYAQAASALCRSTYTSSWSAWAYAGPTDAQQGQLRGWACDPSQSTAVYVAGMQERAQKSGIACDAVTLTGGAGGTWGSWSTVHPMDSPDNGLSLAYPAVHYDSTTAMWWLGVNLADSGSVSGTVQSRTAVFKSPDGIHWTLVQSLYGALYGEVHVLFLGGICYIFDNQRLYTAPASVATTGLEVDLLKLQITEKTNHPTAFTLVFSNTAGQYLNQAALRDNAEIAIYLGLNGTTIQTHTCLIDAVEFLAAGMESQMIVHGRCLQKTLDQVNMIVRAWTGATLSTILQQLLPPDVNLQTLPSTTQFSQTLASFSVIPGQTLLQALTRLADVFQFDWFTTNAGTALKIVERSAGDPSTWTYYSEHLGLAWQINADQPNVIRVVGAPPAGTYTNIFADAIDAANVLTAGVHRYRHIVDRLLDTAAKCQIKANLALRDDQTAAQTGAMTVTLNPGHELLDVITLNEPRAGLTAQPARIKELHTHIDMQSGLWLQQLFLDLP